MKTLFSSLALLAAVAIAPVLGLAACDDDDDNANPSPGPSGTNDDAGPAPSSSIGTGSSAPSTITVRVANLYAINEDAIPGPAVDFVSNDPSNTDNYEIIATNIAYGTLTAPLTLARYDGHSDIYVFPTGTFDPSKTPGFPSGSATSLEFPADGTDSTPTDSAVVILPGTYYQRGAQSHLTVAAGKGAINFEEQNLDSPTPILGYIIDGTCFPRNANGEPFASLDPGPHTVAFIDLAPHDCDPATSTVLHPPTTVEIVAGQVVQIIAPGKAPTDPVLLVPDWK